MPNIPLLPIHYFLPYGYLILLFLQMLLFLHIYIGLLFSYHIVLMSLVKLILLLLLLMIIGCAAGAAAVIVGVILAIVLLGGSRFDFNKEFSDIRYEDWCTIAEDGTWMRLDTNPTDMDSDDMGYAYYSETFNPCNDKIEQVNTELGFSSAVFKKMGETTWSQGRQTESTEKFTVSWTYHPDKGLEVLYEVKK